MNFADGSWRFRPNWLQGRMIPLKVALKGRSNHWRMNRIVMESRFSITHVLARLATVRCQESFESTYLWYKSNLFFGRIERLSILVSISTREDCNFSLWTLLSISKLKYLPKYLNDSPDLTVGTVLWLTNNFGSYWRERDENILIPNVRHLSTLMTILDHWHHFVKQFERCWFSRQFVVTTAASSSKWDHCTGLKRQSNWSFTEKQSDL